MHWVWYSAYCWGPLTPQKSAFRDFVIIPKHNRFHSQKRSGTFVWVNFKVSNPWYRDKILVTPKNSSFHSHFWSGTWVNFTSQSPFLGWVRQSSWIYALVDTSLLLPLVWSAAASFIFWYFSHETTLVMCQWSFKTDLTTVFCQINAPAQINAPPTFDFDWPFLRNYLFDLNHILADKVEIFRGRPLEFHQNQTRVSVRFLSPCLAHLFGKIGYT